MSLTAKFLIRGVGFNAGEVGVVNKTLGLVATIAGALYGGVLMQRLSLFRVLLIFGVLQAISNAGYWLLAISAKNIITMGCAVFFENVCGGVGTAAFVALLMALCNTSFSATQFALLSALSAVGRVYVGPIAGWFVEAHGWPLFYLFSVVAALPGIALLLICRNTLEYTQATATFLPRTAFVHAYRVAVLLLGAGAILLIGWVILLIAHSLRLTNTSTEECLLKSGAIMALLAFIYGQHIGFCCIASQTAFRSISSTRHMNTFREFMWRNKKLLQFRNYLFVHCLSLITTQESENTRQFFSAKRTPDK